MKSIIAAIDFSDVSQKVVSKAADIATLTGAKILVLHVAAPNPDFVGFETGPQTERDFRAESLSAEENRLNEIADQLKEAGLIASSKLQEGPTTATILKEAVDANAEMIVIGSHGHGALFNLVAGSAALDLIKESDIPILVVPARSN